MRDRDAKLVVCGATGYLGRAVVQAADRAGHQARAPARDAAKLEPVRDACAELFASLGDDDAVAPSFGRRRLEDQMQRWAGRRD